MAIRVNHHCNPSAIRIATADFVDAIPQSKCFLQKGPLDGSWPIPTFANKRPPPPWVNMVLDLRINPQQSIERISCITQIPLNDWMNFTAEEIRTKIPRAPGAKGRFRAASNRFSKLKDSLATFLRLQMADVDTKSHIVKPSWSSNETCFFCHKLMRFSAEPSKITRTCSTPGFLSDSLSAEWIQEFDDILRKIQIILDKIT